MIDLIGKLGQMLQQGGGPTGQPQGLAASSGTIMRDYLTGDAGSKFMPGLKPIQDRADMVRGLGGDPGPGVLDIIGPDKHAAAAAADTPWTTSGGTGSGVDQPNPESAPVPVGAPPPMMSPWRRGVVNALGAVSKSNLGKDQGQGQQGPPPISAVDFGFQAPQIYQQQPIAPYKRYQR